MDTMKDTKMQPAKSAVIEELRMLAEDLYVNGYNRYSSAMSKAADELAQWYELEARCAALTDALRLAVRQNNHDMLMTAEELRWCEAILEETK